MVRLTAVDFGFDGGDALEDGQTGAPDRLRQRSVAPASAGFRRCRGGMMMPARRNRVNGDTDRQVVAHTGLRLDLEWLDAGLANGGWMDAAGIPVRSTRPMIR
jgi:hypothetical protein